MYNNAKFRRLLLHIMYVFLVRVQITSTYSYITQIIIGVSQELFFRYYFNFKV